jgi:hypothetical protein
MKRLLAVAIVLLAAVLGCLYLTLRHNGSPDALVYLLSPSWDFGVVAAGGQKIKGRFTIVNASGGSLTIKGTRASCGCTSAEVEPNVILPDKQAIVRVTVDTKGRQGAFNGRIAIHTDNPEYQWLTGAISGYINAPDSILAASPERLSFGEIVAGDDVCKTVLVERYGADSTLAVKAIECANPHLKIDTGLNSGQPQDQTISRLELQISVLPTMPMGPFHCDVTIDTHNTQHARLVVPVEGKVVPLVQASPAQLYLTAGAMKSVTVSLANKKGGSFNLLSVERWPGNLPGEIQFSRAAADTWTITYSIAGQSNSFFQKGLIKAQTNLPECPFVEVPVTIVAPDKTAVFVGSS